MAATKIRKEYAAVTNRSLIVLAISIAIIVIIVVIGVVLGFTLTGDVQKIVLISLIGAVLLVGCVAFAILNCLRRQAKKERDLSAQGWVRQAYEEQRRLKTEPSAPRYESGPYISNPVGYSERSTLPAR